MIQFEEMDFPTSVAERIITQFNITEDNSQDVKDLIYFINALSSNDAVELVYEIFNQIGI